jgi:hypothetical protein
MRVKKYSVSYGFICENGNGFESHRDNGFVGNHGMLSGIARTKEMTYDSLELALAIADPLKHSDWMKKIDCLSRRGDYVTLNLSSMSDTNGIVGRQIKIQKV